MGLRASIYKHRGKTFSGLLADKDEVTIVNIEGPFEPTDDAPAVLLVEGNIPDCAKVVVAEYVMGEDGPEYIELEPERAMGPMDGGTFVYSSDSRFASAVEILTQTRSAAVPLHDRFDVDQMQQPLKPAQVGL